MTDFYKDIVAASGIYKFYLNGQWVESASGKSVSITNPTTNQTAFRVQGALIAVKSALAHLAIPQRDAHTPGVLGRLLEALSLRSLGLDDVCKYIAAEADRHL